jgi:hypothetical protein
MLKKIIKLASFTVISVSTLIGSLSADSYVKGYLKSNGTYVAPHYRSTSNNTINDNWSTKGNVNPYTGKLGTKKSNYGLKTYNTKTKKSWGGLKTYKF